MSLCSWENLQNAVLTFGNKDTIIVAQSINFISLLI